MMSERGGDWISVEFQQQAVRNGRTGARPAWAATMPDRANYRCLGVRGARPPAGKPRLCAASDPAGALASHVLDAMHAILCAAEQGGTVEIDSRHRAARGVHRRRLRPPWNKVET